MRPIGARPHRAVRPEDDFAVLLGPRRPDLGAPRRTRPHCGTRTRTRTHTHAHTHTHTHPHTHTHARTHTHAHTHTHTHSHTHTDTHTHTHTRVVQAHITRLSSPLGASALRGGAAVVAGSHGGADGPAVNAALQRECLAAAGWTPTALLVLKWTLGYSWVLCWVLCGSLGYFTVL